MYRCLEFLDSIPLISQAVWEFDGTLVDSEPVQAEAYRLILAEEGIVPPNGVFVHFVGQTEIWSKLAREYSLTADLTSLRERRLKTLGKLLEDTPPKLVYDTVARLLQRLDPLPKIQKEDDMQVTPHTGTCPAFAP